MRNIFISYRRDDTEGQAGRLFEALRDAFGAERVFMDVATIEPGVDFRRAIERHTAHCGVLLAMIGRNWLNATDENGRRRLDDPDDFVRLETVAALKRDIPVVPVLVHDAQMPRADQLPPALKDLAYRNAVELTHARWDSDVQWLIQALRRQLDAGPDTKPDITPDTTPDATHPHPPRRRWWWFALLVIALAAAVLAALRLWPRAPSVGHQQGLCINGYVWREARVGDVVCVTPERRAITADENRLAARRRNPNGGPYGRDTCLTGYVWREAFDGDTTCVEPASRDAAHADNRAAASRVVP